MAAFQVEIPEQHRKSASGFNMFLLTIVAFASGFVAALSTNVFGLTSTLVACVVGSALGVLVITLGYGTTTQPDSPAPSSQPHWRAGLRVISNSTQLKMVVGASLAYGLCLGLINYSLPFYCYESMQFGDMSYALITGIFSIGSMFGAIAMPILGRWLSSPAILTVGTGGVASSYLMLAAAQTAWHVYVAMLLNGVLFSLLATSQGPILQDFVPPGTMGAVTALLLPSRAALQLVAAAAALVVSYWVAPGNENVHRGSYALAAILLALTTCMLLVSHRQLTEKHTKIAPAQ